MNPEKLEILRQFSRGELRRLQAMDKLDMSYSQILRELGENELPMFRLPEDRVQEMADTFTRVMGQHLQGASNNGSDDKTPKYLIPFDTSLPPGY